MGIGWPLARCSFLSIAEACSTNFNLMILQTSRDSLSKRGIWFEPSVCLAAGASACTLCGVGTYSVNHPSFTISGATCKPHLNQDYFDRNTLVNGYPSYHSADNSVFVWSYEASYWLVGTLSNVGTSSFWAYASCLTSGCSISSAVSWAEYCAASNQDTADLKFLPGPSAGQPARYTLFDFHAY